MLWQAQLIPAETEKEEREREREREREETVSKRMRPTAYADDWTARMEGGVGKNEKEKRKKKKFDVEHYFFVDLRRCPQQVFSSAQAHERDN